MAINVVAGPITLKTKARALYSRFPAAPVNSDLNITIEAGPISIGASVEGESSNVGIASGSVSIGVSLKGGIVTGVVIEAGPITLSSSFKTADFAIKGTQPFVKWSKIGALDFTIDQSNMAGTAPMRWPGVIYKILQLENKVIVYGSGGITAMLPNDLVWGSQEIFPRGIKGKNAAVGSDTVHYFIDYQGYLWEIKQGLRKVGYKEFLGAMTNPVMTMDEDEGLIYICDGTYGYVFNIVENSLGKCPPNITGFLQVNGVKKLVSAGAITNQAYSIITDLYDFGTRKLKAIDYVEISSDVSQNLYVAVDYRRGYKDSLATTPWFLVNPSGQAFCRCDGVEFRLRVKALTYESFVIDSIKFRGHIHNHSYLSSVGGI